jgi:uncharacterized protein
MWIERKISDDLRGTVKSFPVLVLTGPRQAGKTTLLEKLFPDFNYVTLDIGNNAEAAETRPDVFLEQHPPPVILDEIQYAPSFFRHIKNYVDQHRGQNGLFIITGSQNFLLMESVLDSLAGRAVVIPFLGLSAEEWDNAPEIRDSCAWRDFLWRGGFPMLWANPDLTPSRDRWYQGYVATYLERDLRSLLNVGSLRAFARFLRACAARCSQTLNLSEVGRDVGISVPTAKKWLSVLQASSQVFLLEPYFRSLGKRLVKSPKLYFTDTGLVAYLMGFNSSEALWASRSAGVLWENHVVLQWIKHRDWKEPSMGLWYWRDQGGNEVDLLLERNGRLTAIECKLSEKPDKKETGSIERLKTFYGEDLAAQSYIACPVDIPYDVASGITAVPGWKPWPLPS